MEKRFIAALCLLVLCGCGREVSHTDTETAPRPQEGTTPEPSAVAAEPGEVSPQDTVAQPVLHGPVETVDDAVRIGDLVSEQLVADFPGHADALEMRARFEFEFGSPDAAASLWREILTVNPQYTHALAGLGDYEEDRGNLEEAAAFYRRAAETAPEEPARTLKLASCLSEMGQLDEAEALLERVRETHPQNTEARTELGAVLLQQREYDLARAAYREAVELDPTDPKAHGGLATVLTRLGNREQAAEHLKMHRKCRSRRRAALADQRRRYDDVTAISSDIAELLHHIALVYLSQSREDAAVSLLDQAAALSESHLPSRRLLVHLAKQEGDLEEALRWQQQVVRLSPENLQATLQHAMLLGEAGRIDEAEKTVTSFVEEHPENTAAVMTLAQFYVDVKPNLKKAIELTERGAQLSGKADDAVFLAALQERAGETQQATETLQRAASLPGSDARRLHQLLEALRAKLQSDPRMAP